MNTKLATIKTHVSTLIKWGIYLAPVAVLCSLDAYGAFDFDKAKEASITPIKKFVDDTYPIGIFLSGVTGVFLNREGDLRDKSYGFAKGCLAGALIVGAAKAGLNL